MGQRPFRRGGHRRGRRRPDHRGGRHRSLELPASSDLAAALEPTADLPSSGGIDLATLQAEIAAVADPNRPIVLLAFGFGEADTAALQQMVAANGGLGGVWDIDQPQHIIGAMIEATDATLSFG